MYWQKSVRYQEVINRIGPTSAWNIDAEVKPCRQRFGKEVAKLKSVFFPSSHFRPTTELLDGGRLTTYAIASTMHHHIYFYSH